MTKQQFEEYRASLAEVVEKYVAHNSQVYVYKTERVPDENDPCVLVTKWTLLWKGMDWQIVYDEDELNYMEDWQKESLCPYKDNFVAGFCPVLYQDRQFPDSVDEVGFIIYTDEVTHNVSYEDVCPICGKPMDSSYNSTQMCWTCTQQSKELDDKYKEF